MTITRVSRPSQMLVSLFSGLFAERARSFLAIVLVLAASALLTACPVAAHTVTYEMVTIGQDAEFLNAVAATDTFSLYNPSMATDLNTAGIQQNGTSGSYSYSVIGPSGTTPAGANSPGDRPITYVSWFDAARFTNWMQNGQGSGSTETGAYTLNGATSGDAPALNVGATFSIPTENEWYYGEHPIVDMSDFGPLPFSCKPDAPARESGPDFSVMDRVFPCLRCGLGWSDPRAHEEQSTSSCSQ